MPRPWLRDAVAAADDSDEFDLDRSGTPQRSFHADTACSCFAPHVRRRDDAGVPRQILSRIVRRDHRTTVVHAEKTNLTAFERI